MCRSGSCGRSTSTGCRRSGNPSRSCRGRTCVPCPRSSSASARPPAGTSCTPTSTSGSLVGAGEREGAGEGGRCGAPGDAPLMPRSSLPAAWMKEKAAPGDVRYYGEFCVGSALLAPLLLRAGPGYLRGPSLFNYNSPEQQLLWDLCGYIPSAPQQPHGSVQNPAKGKGLEPLTGPIPHPLLKGRTELSSLLQNREQKAKFADPVPGLSPGDPLVSKFP